MIKKVEEIFIDCLYENDVLLDKCNIIEGIKMKVAFDPKKVEENKEEINLLLDNIHGKFKEGWTFLNLCLDKNGNFWTGNHITMEKLLLLGLAIGRIKYCCSKDMWDILPSKMPYIFIMERENGK